MYNLDIELSYAAAHYYDNDGAINNVVILQSLVNLPAWLQHNYPITLDHTIMIARNSLIDNRFLHVPQQIRPK